MGEIIAPNDFSLAKQRFDLVFYISNPRSSNFPKVKRMMKKANGYMENKDTKEYCGFFLLEKKAISLIKEIYLQIFNWKTATVFLRNCPSMSLKDYDNWFYCYLDSISADSSNYCDCIAPFYFKGEYYQQRVEDCFILPCKNKKYGIWGHIKKDTPFVEQFRNDAISGSCKSGLCPKFDMSKFKELKKRRQIEEEIIKEAENPVRGCCFTLSLDSTFKHEIKEEKLKEKNEKSVQKEKSSFWVWFIVLLILYLIFS